MAKPPKARKSHKPRHRGSSPHKRSHSKQSGAPRTSHHIPETCALHISSINDEGELIGTPVAWDSKRKPPYIVITETGRSHAAVVGDTILARLRKISPHHYHAIAIRTLVNDEPKSVLGMLVMTKSGGFIEPISRKSKESYIVSPSDLNGAAHGELVAGITIPGIPSQGMSFAKITERLGALGHPRAASLIATHMHELPTQFSKEALAEAEAAEDPILTKERVDLRDIPLVTIDGEDARDFDDAVFAEPTPNGFHLVVAIADVAHYVTPESALDHDAYQRGNSVYFPDRVIPMLPERLSNGLCSLKPDEERYCLAVHMWIDAHGHIERYEFVRGIMRSRARLTYTEVEGWMLEGRGNGKKTSHTPLPQILTPLWQAYACLAHERDERGALDLNLPEYKITFDETGNVTNIAPKQRLESHRLIEVFMIAANVCAADTLLSHKIPAIYRVHEQPSAEKLEDLYPMLEASGYHLAKGTLKAKQFNHVLRRAEGKPEQFMIHNAVLRSQMPAYYAAENLGHFGLSLQKYCHFTSPIRRYADLVVHRALARLMADDRLQMTERSKNLSSIALHISDTERKAMMAERDASERYQVAYMSRHIGSVFSGTIAGLNEHGLYVALSENGVQGFIPVRHLGQDFFQYDKRHSCFKGVRSKQRYQLGDVMMVRVAEANAMTASLILAPAQSLGFDPRTPQKFKGKHKGKRR